MKLLKLISISLVLTLLWGCAGSGSDSQTLEFYYLRNKIDYEDNYGVFASEVRAPSGDLKKILETYIKGPVSAEFISPFPANLRLETVQDQGDRLDLVFCNCLAGLTGMDLSLACGCLAKTCFSLTGAKEIRICAGDALLDGQTQIIINTDTMLFAEGV